jgi:Holliday junction resolvase RusA-like endonuclease
MLHNPFPDEPDFGPVGTISFFVPGIPSPGGSKKFMGIGRRTGRAIIIDAGGEKTKAWRSLVAAFAYEHRPAQPFRQPLRVDFLFSMPRPKSHFFTGRRAHELRPEAPIWHTNTPDVLKLARSTEDAMTGIIYDDDSATVMLRALKRYGSNPGCQVVIQPCSE